MASAERAIALAALLAASVLGAPARASDGAADACVKRRLGYFEKSLPKEFAVFLKDIRASRAAKEALALLGCGLGEKHRGENEDSDFVILSSMRACIC